MARRPRGGGLGLVGPVPEGLARPLPAVARPELLGRGRDPGAGLRPAREDERPVAVRVELDPNGGRPGTRRWGRWRLRGGVVSGPFHGGRVRDNLSFFLSSFLSFFSLLALFLGRHGDTLFGGSALEFWGPRLPFFPLGNSQKSNFGVQELRHL